jgi:thiol-disulfide isomerase/thioredoxin
VVITMRHPGYRGGQWVGFLLIALVLMVSIVVAKLSNGRPRLYGLLAGVGLGFPIYIFSLYDKSSNPSTWVWLLGWPMAWMYVGLSTLVVITSLWAQCVALWSARQRLFALVTAVGSVLLAVSIWVTGFTLIRFHVNHSLAMQSIPSKRLVDLPLPSLTLTAMDGTPIRTSEFNGQVTVIDFWGTWCAPCIAELPSLEAVQKGYSRESMVKFLLVNPGLGHDTPEKISRFLLRKPLSIPVALDSNGLYFELSQKLENNALPLLIVIDRQGHIRYEDNSFENDDQTKQELRAQIDPLLTEP